MKKSSFKKDGKKRIKWPSCNRYLLTTHLGEKNERIVKCANCKMFLKWSPPRKFKGIVDNKEGKWIAFGPNEGMFTADLTDDEYDDTILE